MRRATTDDKALIESIVNHPGVIDSVSEDHSPVFDATPYLSAPHLALIVKGGCYLARWHGFGRLECHTNFLPDARGINAIREGKKCIAFAFLESNCTEIVTRIPSNNAAAEQYARYMGFKFMFDQAQAWLKNGVRHDVRFYQLTIDQWILDGNCRAAGKRFHDKLQELMPQRKAHIDDDAHDCYVGAAAEMIRVGRADKAEIIYNHWAALAAYEPFTIVSKEPLKIDIKECVLLIENGEMSVEVATCQQ